MLIFRNLRPHLKKKLEEIFKRKQGSDMAMILFGQGENFFGKRIFSQNPLFTF